MIPIPMDQLQPSLDSPGMIPIPVGSAPAPLDHPLDSHRMGSSTPGMIPIPAGSTPAPLDSPGMIPIPLGSTPAPLDSPGMIPIPLGSPPAPRALSFPLQVQGQGGVKFQNWAGTYGSSPELFFRPRSVDEIREILELARQRDKRVKVVGGGHSPSDIACSEDFMIHMGKINRILQVDKDKQQVTVEAGILLSELNLELDKHGMALANLGAVSEVTAAGVIGTGTHNTGIDHGILPTQVVALSLLLASGEILECSDSVNPDIFQAARLHLGCLGIVLSVTFQCVPQFRLREVAFPSTLSQVRNSRPRNSLGMRKTPGEAPQDREAGIPSLRSRRCGRDSNSVDLGGRGSAGSAPDSRGFSGRNSMISMASRYPRSWKNLRELCRRSGRKRSFPRVGRGVFLGSEVRNVGERWESRIRRESGIPRPFLLWEEIPSFPKPGKRRIHADPLHPSRGRHGSGWNSRSLGLLAASENSREEFSAVLSQEFLGMWS
uniref:L-gulonolactone oxidase n=1 Tax=Corvus moneduloides TaxID=1196302 RepID=A0A8U7MNP3_CORMO